MSPIKLNPSEQQSWVINTQAHADIPLPWTEETAGVDVEIIHSDSGYMLRSTGDGEVRLNRTVTVETPLPDKCYLWFGDIRYQWTEPELSPAPSKGFLYVEDLSVVRGDKTILQNLSFTIPPSAGLTGIFGPSGCGKSTLIKTILSKGGTTSGTITRHPESSFCYVPQDDILPDYLTVRGCLRDAIQFRNPRLNHQAIQSRMNSLTDLLGLSPHLDQPIGPLSGGEKKRVSIAMELAGEPDLLLLDEPTSGLDPQSQKTVMDHLRHISREQEIQVVCITHALETLSHFDHILLLRPLSTSPEPQESSLVYAAPVHPDTSKELCDLFELDHLYELFLDRPPQATINRSPDQHNFIVDESANALPVKDTKAFRSFLTQTRIVGQRAWLQVLRNRASWLVLIALPILIGVCIFLSSGWAVTEGDWESGGKIHIPGLYVYAAITGLWLGMTLMIRTVVSERAICARDLRTGLSQNAYAAGKFFFLLSGAFLQTALLTMTMLLMHLCASGRLQLRPPWPHLDLVTVFFLAVFLLVVGGGVVGLAVSAWSRKEFVAVSLVPLFLIPHLLFNMNAFGNTYYEDGNPYNPLTWSRNQAADEDDQSNDIRKTIHHYLSLPLLSRPFINILEEKTYRVLLSEKQEHTHDSAREIKEHQKAFAQEWYYLLLLVFLHITLSFWVVMVSLPRPQSMEDL